MIASIPGTGMDVDFSEDRSIKLIKFTKQAAYPAMGIAIVSPITD